MATFTSNFALTKPDYGEAAAIAVINGNTDEIDEIMHDNRYMMADAWSSSVSYAVGDLCIYENALYKCVTATSGNWDASCWELTTLSENLGGTPEVSKTTTGNPIELTDAASAPMVRCVTEIQGTQDLHGYSKPWVGGSGKNKLPLVLANIKSANTYGTWSGNSYTYNCATYTVNTDEDGNVIGILGTYNGSGASSELHLTFDLPAGDYILSSGFNENMGVNDTLLIKSGATIARGNDNAPGTQFTLSETSTVTWHFRIATASKTSTPMIRLATESDSTFTPYANICPITAYTEGKVVVGDVDFYTTDNTTSAVTGATVTLLTDDSIKVETSSGSYRASKQLISEYGKRLIVGETYTIEADVTITSGIGCISMRSSSGTMLSYSDMITSNGHLTFTFTLTSAMDNLSFFCTVRDSEAGNVTYSNIRFYKGNHIDDVEKGVSISHTTTYPTAIYRGSEDVAEGEVTSEWRKISITNVALYGNYGDDNAPLFYADIGGANIMPYSKNTLTINKPISNFYTPNSANTEDGMNDFEFRTNNSPTEASRFYFRDSRFTTAEDFNTYLANNPIEIAFMLFAPTTTTVTVSNAPIRTLSGYTHIESTTGDMEVEYITQTYEPIVKALEH